MFQELLESNGSSGGGNCKCGYIDPSDLTGSDYYVSGLGFKPKHICWFSPSTYNTVYYYDEDVSQSLFYGTQYNYTLMAGASIGGNSYWCGLKSVEIDGFKLEYFTSTYIDGGIYWFASAD